MATKARSKSKAAKKHASRASAGAKSMRLKTKAAKAASSNGSRNGTKPRLRRPNRESPKVESGRPAVAGGDRGLTLHEHGRTGGFASAVRAYESGIRFMHAEEFEKAIRCFENLISSHPDEPEIQGRAKVLLLACEKRVQEKEKRALRSADDYYNVGVAELNRRELNAAIDHLERALKLMPKADHILYALATANALQGNREEALRRLREAIGCRGENRFFAARDSDFDSLREDAEFKKIITPEK